MLSYLFIPFIIFIDEGTGGLFKDFILPMVLLSVTSALAHGLFPSSTVWNSGIFIRGPIT